MKNNESLAERLVRAEVYDEFCALMFGQKMRYEDLLEQLESWQLSSSLGALTRFSDSHRSQWILARAKAEHKAILEDSGSTLDAAQRKLVAENLFNLAASPEVSDKTLLKMRDQEIKLAELANDKIKIEQGEKKLAQAQELIELQKAKIEEQRAQAAEAAAKIEQLRDPAKAADPEMRKRILDEVDRAMGIKK